MKNPVIHLSGVDIGYERRPVISDVNLSIYKSDFLAIIGANGSGKTTLLKTILRLIPALSGQIEYNFLSGKSPNIGYLPQFSPIDQDFPVTVKEVVHSGLLGKRNTLKRISSADKVKILDTLDWLGIIHLKDKTISKLSGGEMQRMFLARAIVSEPTILILDEPSTFIDKKFQSSFYELLTDLNKNIPIVMVSHDLNIIMSSVKNIACISGGNLHYHSQSEFSGEFLSKIYGCPVEVLAHGDVPHRVLKKH